MKTFTDIVAEHNQVLGDSMASFEKNFDPALDICLHCLQNQGKVLICGNGGSAADAQHFAAELVGRFEKERSPWPAVALCVDTSIITALANDYGFEQVFARQVQALGRAGDVLVALSTSGNSPNVIRAAETARKTGIKVIAMTGEGGGALADLADVLFAVPSRRTARIQEVHEICLHGLAQAIENGLTNSPAKRKQP
ncbi:MAG: D-sedoheptulose-7-phosphate isomerase [Desulfosalsimonas sp.]